MGINLIGAKHPQRKILENSVERLLVFAPEYTSCLHFLIVGNNIIVASRGNMSCIDQFMSHWCDSRNSDIFFIDLYPHNIHESDIKRNNSIHISSNTCHLMRKRRKTAVQHDSVENSLSLTLCSNTIYVSFHSICYLGRAPRNSFAFYASPVLFLFRWYFDDISNNFHKSLSI